MKTTLDQACRSYADDAGAVHFEIENSITFVKEGDLPFPEIFLFEIATATDPKADVFQRIATLADLTSTPRGRDAALGQGTTAYLSSTFTITYDDLATAVQAKSVIQARIDDLVSQWLSYEGEFVNPSTITVPLAASSIVTAAKNTLVAALADRDKKEAALEQLTADLAAKESAAQSAAATLVAAEQRSDTSTRSSTLMDAVTTAVAALSNADLTALVAALETELSSERSSAGADLAAAKAAKRSADAAAATAKTQVTQAEAALTAAQQDADAALVLVTNYCPTFDPAKDL